MIEVQVQSESSVVGVQQEEQIGTPVVVALTGISDRSIFRRIAKGVFPAGTRVGRFWKWNRSEVEKWIAENPQGKQAPAKPKPAPAKTKKVKLRPKAAAAEAVFESVPVNIPPAVLAAVENVAPVGADLIAMEVGGAA